MYRIGRIGAVVEPTITPKAKKLLVEVPIYFNQYIPGVKNSTFEVIGVFIGEQAEKINKMAEADKKDNVPTKGKGMMVDILGKPYTEKYMDSNKRLVKKTKMYIVDVSYPNIYGSNNNDSSYNNTQTSTTSSTSQIEPSNSQTIEPYHDTDTDDDPLESYEKMSNK